MPWARPALAKEFPVHPLVGQRMTLDAFLKLPEEKPYLELWDGVVVQKAWAGPRHGALQPELTSRINQFAEPRRLALAFLELTTVFGGSALTPDVTVYRWDRVPRDADGWMLDEYGGVPDVAAEITSPEQGANYPLRRCLWYLEHGVPLVLQVDPDDDSVVDFRPDTAPRVLRGADRINLDTLLPGFELTVQDLFDALRLD
ncbi:MAG: Uma2 family endonuclease [Chloroflexi bacterium]|nr:Uma2 family endonuclease [Chloroflexota bacterium]